MFKIQLKGIFKIRTHKIWILNGCHVSVYEKEIFFFFIQLSLSKSPL